MKFLLKKFDFEADVYLYSEFRTSYITYSDSESIGLVSKY